MPIVFIQAQNLVPNPSFEDITDCPSDQGQIYLAKPWFMTAPCSFEPTDFYTCSSSELFHECSVWDGNTAFLNVGIPINSFGYQNARTGRSYAGTGVWIDGDWRERIETPLISSLQKDSCYYVKMYVVNKKPIGAEFTSTSNLHFLFTNDSLVDYPTFTFTKPSVKNPDDNIISDTTNWTKIMGCYKAKGGERFLTIGSFYDNAHSNLINPNAMGAYYLIDDVSVELSDGINCSCNSSDSTNTKDSLDVLGGSLKQVIFPNVITPNNDKVNDVWSVDFIDSNESIEIYNRWGIIIARLNINFPFWDGTSNGKQCTEGIYFYRAYLRKETKNGFIHLVR